MRIALWCQTSAALAFAAAWQLHGRLPVLPAITALNLFEGRVDQVRLSMRDASARILAALHARPMSRPAKAAD